MAKTEHDTAVSTKGTRDELGRFVAGNAGSMKKFTNREDLVEAVAKYLDSCDGKNHPTMTGLALTLGFRGRTSLVNYQKEEGYEFAFDIIQFAKMKIEEYLEQHLL